MKRQFILLKDLPGCPKGRIFKEDINGNYFHSMTDDEFLSKKYQPYNYSKDAVIGNGMWFKELTEIPPQYGDKVHVSLDKDFKSVWYGIYIGKHPTKNLHIILTRARPKLKIRESIDTWKYCKKREW